MKRTRIKYRSLDEKILQHKTTLAKEYAKEMNVSLKEAFKVLQFKRDMRHA